MRLIRWCNICDRLLRSYHCAGTTGWIKADPDDDKVVETAVVGNAEFIVSGDHHLLDLDSIEGIAIVNAREFVRCLRSNA